MEKRFKILKTVIFLYTSLNVVLVASADVAENNSTKPRTQLQFTVEREELDLKKLKDGARIDFIYNETAAFPGNVVSSPGCPKSYEGRPWVYFRNSTKCYLVGFQGPCSLGQRMFYVPNSKYGVCNCDCFKEEIKTSVNLSPQPVVAATEIIDYAINEIFQNVVMARQGLAQPQSSYQDNAERIIRNPFAFLLGNRSRGERQISGSPNHAPLQETQSSDKNIDGILAPSAKTRVARAASKESKNRYSFCFSNWYGRQVVYDSLRQECTPFLDQGPCKKGEWLVRNLEKENGVTCEKRKCRETPVVEPELGGKFSYFDYRRQACFSEVYGTSHTVNYNLAGSILSGPSGTFCREAGMRYSRTLKTCVKAVGKDFQYKAIG